MTDIRGLVVEAQADARARVRRRLSPAVLFFAVLAASMLTQWALTGWAASGLLWAGATGLWALVMVAATAAVALSRYPVRSAHVEGTLDDDGGLASVLRKPPGAFRASATFFGCLAMLFLGLAAASGLDSDGGRAAVGVLVAVCLAFLFVIPAALAVSGRRVAGQLVLHERGLRFRQALQQINVAWDDIVAVHVDESLSEVGLTLVADSPGRVWPIRKEGEHDVVLRLREWGTLPTDVARLILHLASDRDARHDAGYPDAVTMQLDALRAAPVSCRHASWTVGRDTGLEEVRREDTDPWVPVRGTELFEGFAEQFRLRGALGFGIAGLLLSPYLLLLLGGVWGALAGLGFATATVAVTALAVSSGSSRGGVGPPLAAELTGDGGVVLRRASRRSTLLVVAGIGLSCVAAAATARFAESWPAVAVVAGAAVAVALLVPLGARLTGRWHVGELVLDEHAMTYRSGRSTTTVRWSQLARADALWRTVLRVEDRDGASWRLDVRGMAATPSALVRILEDYAQTGGPRGATRDPEAVRQRLAAFDAALSSTN